MKTKKETRFIAFSSQKGGVGKSTFTTLAASVMHYKMGFNVVVFDVDFPQHSLVKMKKRDLQTVVQNEHVKKIAYKLYTSINKKAYPIIEHKAEGVLEAAYEYLEKSSIHIDAVFFDLPGTVNTPGILNALAGMHHIFTPITADRVVMESTLVFTQILNDVIRKKAETSIKTIHLFWNQVDAREKSPLYAIYSEMINDLGLSVMKSNIMNSIRFRKEAEILAKTVFRSTLLPPDENLMRVCRLDEFLNEFLQIIKL